MRILEGTYCLSSPPPRPRVEWVSTAHILESCQQFTGHYLKRIRFPCCGVHPGAILGPPRRQRVRVVAKPAIALRWATPQVDRHRPLPWFDVPLSFLESHTGIARSCRARTCNTFMTLSPSGRDVSPLRARRDSSVADKWTQSRGGGSYRTDHHSGKSSPGSNVLPMLPRGNCDLALPPQKTCCEQPNIAVGLGGLSTGNLQPAIIFKLQVRMSRTRHT